MSRAALPDAWKEDRRCSRSSLGLFYSELVADQERAKRICAQCAVWQKCLSYALMNREEHGVWGGTTEAERKSILRIRQMVPSVAAEQDAILIPSQPIRIEVPIVTFNFTFDVAI